MSTLAVFVPISFNFQTKSQFKLFHRVDQSKNSKANHPTGIRAARSALFWTDLFSSLKISKCKCPEIVNRQRTFDII